MLQYRLQNHAFTKYLMTSWQLGNAPNNRVLAIYYNMTVWILAGNYSSFTIAAGLIRLRMPGVKKSRV